MEPSHDFAEDPPIDTEEDYAGGPQLEKDVAAEELEVVRREEPESLMWARSQVSSLKELEERRMGD